MRLLLLLALVGVPSIAQQASRFTPPPPKPATSCDVPANYRNPFGAFNFCLPAQATAAKMPEGNMAVHTVPWLRTVCSIPLLNVPALETHDRMVASAPPAQPPFAVPAPAPRCENWSK